MEYITITMSYWLHLLATVIWTGGIFLILFAVLPSAKEYLNKEASGFMSIISKRFTPFANYSILILVVTGILMISLNKGFNSLIALETIYSKILFLKILIVAIMIIIHFYRGLMLNPRITKFSLIIEESSAEESEKISSQISNLKNLSLNLVKINLGLGMIILILSSLLLTI